MLRRTQSSSALTTTPGKWISFTLTHVILQKVLTRILRNSRFLPLMKFPRRTKKNLTSFTTVISQALQALRRGGSRQRSQSRSWQCSMVERVLKWTPLSAMRIKAHSLTQRRESRVDLLLIAMERLSGL